MLGLLHLPAGRLRYWERLGLVEPGLEARQAVYSLQDLIALRAIVRLTASGVPAARVRAALRVLSLRDPMSVKKPLLELHLHAVGGQVVQVEDGLLIEPATGQRVLDLDGLLAPAPSVRELRPWSVNEMMSTAMRADLDPTRWEQAAEAYRRVIHRAPERIEAHINLGTLEFKRGRLQEAEAAYRRALAIDPRHAVVRFNLANVLDERDRPHEALPHLLAAFELEPENGDVRFNLAALLERLGRAREARVHWLAYLQIDASSEWAALARRHLGQSEPEAGRVIAFRPRPRR